MILHAGGKQAEVLPQWIVVADDVMIESDVSLSPLSSLATRLQRCSALGAAGKVSQ